MANIGDKLTSPENGWKRIDDTNLNIKYIGTWDSANYSGYYNNTRHITSTDNSYIEFYFYGSQIRLITLIDTNRGTNNITIDGISENYSSYSDSANFQCLVYEKTGLNKNIHYVRIKKISTYLDIDAIDIDEDGYMIYQDDNGKLYYDITPIMTSNTTPSPYVAESNSEYNSAHQAWYLFDGNLDPNVAWASSVSAISNIYVTLSLNKKMNTIFIRGCSNRLQNPKDISIMGSNDNSTFDNILDYEISIENSGTLLINTKTTKYKYYKLLCKNNNGANNIALVELRYLLAVDTPFYLIQDNTNNKIYNYDEENNQLVETTDISILKENTLNNTCIYDLNKVKDLINLTDDNITILSNQNSKLIVNGIKSDKELIISNQNLSTVNAETIHDYLFEVTKVTNGDCKFVISADNGQTWISWNGTSWNTLTNTATLDSDNKIKQYSKLSDSEKVQWNKLKEEIWTSGMSTDIADVDYNSILTNRTIRFAFVLYRPSYDDNVTLKDTQWLFDRVGSWHKLSEDDIDITINSNMCTVTPKLQNLEHVKVNILL